MSDTLPAGGSFSVGPAAGFAPRLVALVIDWFSAVLIAALVTRQRVGDGIAPLLTLGIFALEVWLLTAFTGSSFGQRLRGLQVVRLDGRLLEVGAAFIRTALICLVIPPLIYDPAGRGLHDKVVGSIVVRRRTP